MRKEQTHSDNCFPGAGKGAADDPRSRRALTSVGRRSFAATRMAILLIQGP